MKKQLLSAVICSAVVLSACGQIEDEAKESKPEEVKSVSESAVAEESEEVQEAAVEPEETISEAAEVAEPDSVEVWYDSVYEELPEDYDPAAYHADESFDQSWTIDDAEILSKIDRWIADYESSNTAIDEALGCETIADRYSFTRNGQEIKLGFYDDTGIIIGENCYPATTFSDYKDLISLISNNPEKINVKTGDMRNHSAWTIDDSETVREIISVIEEVEKTEPLKEVGFTAGGHAPDLSFIYNGSSYYVQLAPSGDYSNINIMKDDIRTSYLYDDDVIQQLYDTVMSFKK